MKLAENPIFITHKRIVRRNGVLAATLIAGLVGFCLLLGLSKSLHDDFAVGRQLKDDGKLFYGWIIAIEMLVLVIGGASRISRALADDRKSGMWDSNRLTPLTPGEIIAGYWFGPVLREFYMAAILAAFGLIITLSAGLPLVVWFESQALIVSTALFFGLIGVMAGQVMQRAQGLVLLLSVLVAYPFSFSAPSRMITNFLLPIYGIGQLFASNQDNEFSDWRGMPDIFGIRLPAMVISLGLQVIFGTFVWRSLSRRVAHPFQPLLRRWEAVALFAVLVVAQHGLLWSLWYGRFPHGSGKYGMEFPLQAAHGAILLLGVILLAMASPEPERVRVDALRLQFKSIRPIFSRSAVSLALMLTLVAGGMILTHFMFVPKEQWRPALVVVLNLAEVFLIFALLIEYCRLRFGQRALSFLMLWLFLLCVTPFILSGVFANSGFAQISFLSPGFLALSSDDNTDWTLLFSLELAYLGVIALLANGWRRQWRRLLTSAKQ